MFLRAYNFFLKKMLDKKVTACKLLFKKNNLHGYNCFVCNFFLEKVSYSPLRKY